jgi:hypothetical protein
MPASGAGSRPLVRGVFVRAIAFGCLSAESSFALSLRLLERGVFIRAIAFGCLSAAEVFEGVEAA